ncbi:MAG TPA: DUF72 domain-containing protein [Thermohalobaculum sp.]|nr:DUF72 domain-containing protein [Thermohalobaculum sp.]
MIRVGIGGWTYKPWRGVFYPEGLKQADELRHASRQVTTIEINGTFYRTQSRASFAKWRDETPEGFVFAVKGHRAIVNKRRLAETGEAIGWFMASGVPELGRKLGPLLWQFPPTRAFDADDVAAFLDLLPREAEGRVLRHVLEVRHESFKNEAFVALARRHGVAVATVDGEDRPLLGDVTADFVYARLQRTEENVPTGYDDAALDRWAEAVRAWEAGEAPPGLPLHAEPAPREPRDVFVYMIAGAKVRAPAAATALLERLDH